MNRSQFNRYASISGHVIANSIAMDYGASQRACYIANSMAKVLVTGHVM